MKTSIAIYPGSFDPVTNGHLDLIERGEKMFDLLIVAVLRNAEKEPLFSVAERIEMLREVTKQWTSVEIDVFDGLLVEYARKRGAGVILRGIRAVSDYEYELQMALMNRKLEPRLETVFMLPGLSYSYLSSKLVREIGQLGASLKGLVGDFELKIFAVLGGLQFSVVSYQWKRGLSIMGIHVESLSFLDGELSTVNCELLNSFEEPRCN